MRETLILRLPAQADGDAEWLVRAAPGDDGAASAPPQRGALSDAVEAAKDRRLIVLVPSQDCLLTKVSLAVRQQARLAQAVPYALEEHLAEEVDDLHFAIGPRQASGETPVAVVSRARMQGWLEPFTAAGVQPDLMLPELIALPLAGDEVVVCSEPGQCLVRTDSYSGFACEPENLNNLLHLVKPDEAVLNLALIEVVPTPVVESDRVSIARAQTPDSLISAMREAGDSARLNLLQGTFAPRRATDAWLRAFRLPAALAASWLLLATIGMGIANSTMSSERDRLYAQAEQTFRQAFPNLTRIVDLRAQAEQQLRSLGGSQTSGGFLTVLEASGRAVASVPALQLEGLQYRDGSLYLSLSGSDLQALDLLRAEFEKVPALKLEVQSSQLGAEGVQIRLKVDYGSGRA